MKLAYLVGITIIAWILILLEAYLLFDVIIAFAPPIHNLGSLTALALLKVAATLGLGILWFVVVISLSRTYVRSKLRHRPPTSLS